MTRRIMLDLAPDTTDEDCGSCNECGGAWVGGEWTNWSRGPDCIAAESRAARMIEIDPADAARYIQWRDTFTPHPRNVDRLKPIDDVLREHAKKAVPR